MQIDYQKLARELIAANTTKAVSTTPTAALGYAPGGLFTTPGLRKPVFSALQLPVFGLQKRIPSFSVNEANAFRAILTGQTANSGTQPTGPCDPPRVVGNLKLCTQAFPFGRWSLSTKVYDISKVGQIANYQQAPGYLQLQNMPDVQGYGPTLNGGSDPFKDELSKALFELGVGWAYEYGRQIYNGTPANNTSGGGYQEFYGLESLVNDHYIDSVSLAECPAANSLVYNFNGANISGAGNAANATALINRVTWFYRALKDRAAKTQMKPVKWVIVTSQTAFYDIAESWACNYSAARCNNTSTSTPQFLSADAMIALRDRMLGGQGDTLRGSNANIDGMFEYTGQYLLIDGEQVEVILDDTLPYSYNSGTGTYTADMYILPLVVKGRMPALYFENFNFDAPGAAMSFADKFAPQGTFYTSDGGRFLWTAPAPSGFCVQLYAVNVPRLMLDVPFLAARITDISWTPFLSFRSPFPGESNYVNGGHAADSTAFSNNYSVPTGATQLLITTQPAGAASGVNLATQPVVKAYLLDGTTVDTNFNGNVTVAIEAGTGLAGATLNGTTTVAAVDGVATFAGLSITGTANGYKLRFTSDHLTSALSNAFNIT